MVRGSSTIYQKFFQYIVKPKIRNLWRNFNKFCQLKSVTAAAHLDQENMNSV